MMEKFWLGAILFGFFTIPAQPSTKLLNSDLSIEETYFERMFAHRLRGNRLPIALRHRIPKLPQRFRGGADIPELYPQDSLPGIDRNETALEWEIAEAEDWIGNKFTYFRNRWSGLLLELNHVRCGSFRFSHRNEPISPDGWVVTPPHLVDAGGCMFPPAMGNMWRCPFVPELFASTRRGCRPGEPSAPSGPSATEKPVQAAAGPDPVECAVRHFERTAEELEEDGVHAGRMLIWPGSAESVARTAELAASGLVLRDQPEFARFRAIRDGSGMGRGEVRGVQADCTGPRGPSCGIWKQRPWRRQCACRSTRPHFADSDGPARMRPEHSRAAARGRKLGDVLEDLGGDEEEPPPWEGWRPHPCAPDRPSHFHNGGWHIRVDQARAGGKGRFLGDVRA